MKIVFESPSEKKRIEAIVRDASSVSNSQSLMALVADGVIEGEDAPAIERGPAEAPDPRQEPMADLIARADEMGIRGASEMSRAGIMQAMEGLQAFKDEQSKPEEPKVPTETPSEPMVPVELTDEELIEKADALGIDTEGLNRNAILDAIKEKEV